MFNLFKYTEKKLVKELRAILARNEPGLNLDYDPDNSSVSISGDSRFSGSPMVINLANLFIKMRNLETVERVARLEINMREFLSGHEFSSDDLVASLALRVRTGTELAIRELYMQVHSGESLDTLAIMSNELFLELVSDRQESLATVDLKTLAKASISKEEAFEIATARLARCTDTAQWQQIDQHIWRSSYEDDYDFARIVSAETNLRLPSDANVVFYAPSHSVVLVCDLQDQKTLQKMIELGDQASEDHRPLSQNLWHYNAESEWTRWQQDSEPSLAQLQVYKELIDNYEEQKNLLDRWLTQIGEDSFVAAYSVYEQNGCYRSMCVYTLNVPSYLPKTEWVTVFDADDGDEGGIVGELSWQAFVDSIGQDAMTDISNGRLERFKLLSSLSRDQEAALRTRVKID